MTLLFYFSVTWYREIEDFIAVTVFCSGLLCNLVNVYWYFRGMCASICRIEEDGKNMLLQNLDKRLSDCMASNGIHKIFLPSNLAQVELVQLCHFSTSRQIFFSPHGILELVMHWRACTECSRDCVWRMTPLYWPICIESVGKRFWGFYFTNTYRLICCMLFYVSGIVVMHQILKLFHICKCCSVAFDMMAVFSFVIIISQDGLCTDFSPG